MPVLVKELLVHRLQELLVLLRLLPVLLLEQ
jgi:hypothetical protein